jgi:peptide/nickel transport system permease protein
MTTYIIRRCIIGIIILLLVTMLVFLFIHLLPGDPLMIYLGNFNPSGGGSTFGPEQLAIYRHQYGLDRSLPVQYWDWLTHIFRGDLGKSIGVGQPISSLIADAMPRTAYIGIIVFVIGRVGGMFTGIICAIRRGSWMDNTLTTLANIGMTIPVFWLGILFIYLFSVKLHWLPTHGWGGFPWDKGFWESTKYLIMPILAVALGSVAGLARLVRSCMLEVMRTDYVRTAWAKGLRERVILVRHQIKNAMIPVVTALGTALAGILGGSVFIETVFAIPGMGRLITSAIFDYDYQVVQAGVLIFGFIIIISNLVVDIAWGWLDPRIRLA